MTKKITPLNLKKVEEVKKQETALISELELLEFLQKILKNMVITLIFRIR